MTHYPTPLRVHELGHARFLIGIGARARIGLDTEVAGGEWEGETATLCTVPVGLSWGFDLAAFALAGPLAQSAFQRRCDPVDLALMAIDDPHRTLGDAISACDAFFLGAAGAAVMGGYCLAKSEEALISIAKYAQSADAIRHADQLGEALIAGPVEIGPEFFDLLTS